MLKKQDLHIYKSNGWGMLGITEPKSSFCCADLGAPPDRDLKETAAVIFFSFCWSLT